MSKIFSLTLLENMTKIAILTLSPSTTFQTLSDHVQCRLVSPAADIVKFNDCSVGQGFLIHACRNSQKLLKLVEKCHEFELYPTYTQIIPGMPLFG